jgi:hypothetical protein
MAETPLASDGKYIYALSMKLKKEDDDDQIEAVYCNVFSLELDALKMEREFELKIDFGEDKSFKPHQKNGGFFNDWNIACNGEVLIVL